MASLSQVRSAGAVQTRRPHDCAKRSGAAMTACAIPPPPNTALDQARRFLAKTVPWPKNGEGYVKPALERGEAGRDQAVLVGPCVPDARGCSEGTHLDYIAAGQARNLRLHELPAD